MRHARTLAAAAALALPVAALAACGSGGDDDAVVLTVEPSAIPAFVAEAEGFFGDTEVEVTTVGYEEAESLLIAGQTQIAWIGPLDTAQFASEGEDFRYISTAGALNMYNGVVIRAEDADQYQTIEDLAGMRLGIPGFGTGTWASFDVFARTYFGIDDPEEDFDVITADSGALLALLERGEIDAALLFAASSAAGRYMDQFETVFSFTEVMQEEYGVPLVVNGPTARADWIEDNPDAVADVIAGLDQAVQWMSENPDAFREDGEYARFAAGDGWHTDEATTDGILSLLADGEWYLTSDAYTDEWRDAVYEVVQAGEGSLVDSVPDEDAIFAETD
jgi:ABC-type nitrate/sulfonate/bicarbonate transport system substrate-binding protein